MVRLRNVITGVYVNVREDKVALLGSSWTSKEDAPKAEGYAAMKVDDLKAEIESRNEARDEDDLLSMEGRKADLVAILEADDSSKSE